MISPRSWASRSGLPTRHAIDAAISVARVIGTDRARVIDARESYWRRADGGILSPADLGIGEELLIASGLAIQQDAYLVITSECVGLLAANRDELAAVLCLRAIAERSNLSTEEEELAHDMEHLFDDEALQRQVLRSIASLYDGARLAEIGTIGEELVLSRVKMELVALGHQNLADQVRWVSQLDDSAGYDIAAPYIGGGERLLEVKSTNVDGDVITIHLSRNEAETGMIRRDWLLIVCRVTSVESRLGVVLGWMTVKDIESRFPVDSSGGKWESVAISLDVHELVPGIPGSAR